MNKKFLYGGLASLVVGLSLVGTAWAYQGDNTKKGPNYNSERQAKMIEVMNKGDYAGWQELMAGRGRVSQMINQQNFSKFVEAWKLEQAGKVAEARAIRQELGLGGGKAGCQSDSCGMRSGGHRGQSQKPGFVDANNDGICDHHQTNK